MKKNFSLPGNGIGVLLHPNQALYQLNYGNNDTHSGKISYLIQEFQKQHRRPWTSSGWHLFSHWKYPIKSKIPFPKFWRLERHLRNRTDDSKKFPRYIDWNKRKICSHVEYLSTLCRSKTLGYVKKSNSSIVQFSHGVKLRHGSFDEIKRTWSIFSKMETDQIEDWHLNNLGVKFLSFILLLCLLNF